MNIKELKKELGLRQKDLAELFEVSADTFKSSTAKNRYQRVLCNFFELLKQKGYVRIEGTDDLREVAERFFRVQADKIFPSEKYGYTDDAFYDPEMDIYDGHANTIYDVVALALLVAPAEKETFFSGQVEELPFPPEDE